jgi:hypothetical protein
VRNRALCQRPGPDNTRLLLCGIIGCAIVLGGSTSAFAKDGDSDGDDDDSGAKSNSAWPTTYLDMRTTYATVPAGSLPIGFGNTALFTAIESLALSTGNGLPALPTSLPLASRQGVAIDFPLTVDVTDHVSLYAGLSGTATNTSGVGWSSFDVTSWNVGFQADVYEQNGGRIPTITWQSTYTQSIPNNTLGTTTFNNVLEFDYAFDKDETRGLLAGVQDTRVEIGTALASVHPNDIFYVGGYYQWPSNWKFTGRLGVQYFGGAELLRFTAIQSFTQPILRLDLDRMDDNDNRLFGVTAEIMWVPKPAYVLTLRTPLYLVQK